VFGAFKLLIVMGVAVVSGVAAILNALYGPRAQARKRLRAAPRELTDGAVVTLTGVVRAKGAMLTAPLSGKQVVAFSAMARIYELQGRHKVVVDQIAQRQFVEFFLDTKDGPVLVDATTVELEFPPEPLIPRKIEREQAYLETCGHGEKAARNAGFDEAVIVPGMKVSVHGAVRVEVAQGEAGYRETGKQIVLAPPPGLPLTIGRPV
jgi:hypothetical protein